MSDLAVIVLAAGHGKRMKSALAKVLHRVAGRPMVLWSIASARELGAKEIVTVVGQQRDAVVDALSKSASDARIAVQEQQNGTGDAVRVGLEAIPSFAGRVAILYGDCPLVPPDAIRALSSRWAVDTRVALLTSRTPNPAGYGRIIRARPANGGDIIGIREDRDCTELQRSIDEVNPGVYLFDAAFLRSSLAKLDSKNAQGELYLTDVVAMAAETSPVVSHDWSLDDLRGVNDRSELALVEARARTRIISRHLLAGVTVRDPSSTYIDVDVTIAEDVTLEAGVVLRGRTSIGTGARVDVGSVLDDVECAPHVHIKPYSVASQSTIGTRAQIGPFAHLRPGAMLGEETHIGNYVEVKQTTMGRGSKANHLAYLGDGVIGENVNVGAGTIFCNYDGFSKHTTTLEDGVFIGSDSQLVAPIRVGKNAYVATGTTVTKDVPADALAIARAKQENKEGYAPRLRARMAAMKRAKTEGEKNEKK